MRISIVLVFFVMLVNITKSQNYGYTWHSTSYGWLGSNGTCTKLHDDEKGKIYSATQGFLSKPQLLIEKKNIVNGNMVYNLTLEDPGMGFTYPYCRVLKSDDAGNLYVTGNINGSPTVMDFDGTFGTYTVGAPGSSDFIAKYSPTGSLIYVFLTKETISDLAFDSQGNIYTVGSFTGSVDFDWSTNTNTLTSNGSTDIFIAKYSSTGQYIRAYNMGGPNTEYGMNIVNDGSDKFIIAGTFSNTPVDFDPKAMFYFLTPQGASDVYLARYDSIFTFNWAHAIGGTGSESLYKMEKENKKINIIAYFNSPTMDVDLGPSTLNLTSSGPNMHGMISYDTSRVLQFGYALNFNSLPPGAAYAIDLNTNGNLAVAGSYTAAIDADIGPGVATMTMVPPTTTCCPTDFFLGVYNSTGYLKAYAFGSMPDANNRAECIVFNSNDEIILGGTDLSVNSFKFDFDPGPGIAWAPVSSGFNHGFVAKYGYCTTAPSGTVGSISGPTTVCANTTFQSYSITPVSGASSYSWTASATFTGGNFANSYDIYFYSAPGGTIQVQPFNACGTSTTIQTLSITVNPNPTISAVTSASVLCSGQTSTLTASGALTYSWSTSTTGSATAVSPTVNTTYSVIGTDINGCSNSTSITQSVSTCIGIKESVNNSTILLYPNPTSGELILKTEQKENLLFEVYNVLGGLILKQNIYETETKINLKEQAGGIYFVRIIENEKVISNSKIIKQ